MLGALTQLYPSVSLSPSLFRFIRKFIVSLTPGSAPARPSVRCVLVSRSINAFFLWCGVVVWRGRFSSQEKLKIFAKYTLYRLYKIKMANELKEINDIVKKCKILLLDIEGTTTSISFVKVGLIIGRPVFCLNMCFFCYN